MNVQTIQINNQLVTSACLCLLLIGIVAYMYFLSLSVVHVVMRKEVNQQIGQMRSEIASLEASYIDARLQISTRVATLDGFSQNQKKVFINKGEQSLVLRSTSE